MIDSNEVNYKLTLTDMMTGKIHETNREAERLEATLGSVEKIAGAMGIAFGIFEGVAFIKEASEAWDRIEQSEAQVMAGLESTGYAAGLTFDEMRAKAISLSSHLKYSRDEITSMEAMLLTFPAVTKKTFDEASTSVLDLATRFKTGPQEAAIQLGKALQDPIRGVAALHRVGVNFTEQQQEQIKKFVEGGNLVAAQTVILSELQKEVGGSAQAAFDADKLAGFSKTMETVRDKVGELTDRFQEMLAPALNTIANGINDVVDGLTAAWDWVDRNSGKLEVFGGIVFGVSAAYALFNVWQKITYMWMMREEIQTAALIFIKGGLTVVTEGLTAAVTALNLAFEANPIGFVIAGFIAAGIAIYAVYQHSFRFQAAIAGILAAVKDFGRHAADVFMAVGRLMLHIATGQVWKVAGDFSDLKRLASEAGGSAANAYNETYKTTLADLNKKANDEKKKEKKTAEAPGVKPDNAIDTNIPKADKASGTKAVTINIHINKLIDRFEINTNKLGESYSKIQEHVANALLAAANDASLQADI